jgi:prolyl-tRNA synthetase
LVGVIVEHFADEKGLAWPRSVAPYVAHLIRLDNTPSVTGAADTLYAELTKQNIAVIYDDRDQRAGEKFADADLLGMPFTVLVSEKTVGLGKVELKERATGAVKHMTKPALVKYLAS